MCEALSGKSKNVMLGRKITDALPQIRKVPMLMQALSAALEGHKSFVPADSGSFEGEYMESHIIPLRDEQEKVAGILVIRHDVAHRQKAEEELKRLNLVLEQKARELEQRHAELVAFGKITSYDPKEPLRKINVFSDMLTSREEGQLTETGRAILQRLKRLALKAETITDDIFSFSHLQQFSELPEVVSLDIVLKVVRHKLKQQLLDTGATLAAGALPVLLGYRHLLQQLFQNLIDNALKFRQQNLAPVVAIEGGSCAGNTLRHPDALPDRDYMWVRFTDNGSGFEDKYAARIFELFERLHPSGEFAGNGIGLSLCRRIMELHHGFIQTQSIVGKGSSFTCYFPGEKRQ